MGLTYTAASLEDIAKQFDDRAKAATERAAQYKRGFGVASGINMAQAIATGETWRTAAAWLRATTLTGPAQPGGPLHPDPDAALRAHADRLQSALYDMIGNVDYTQHCCAPTSMVAAALPVETLAEARDAVLQYINFKKA